MALPDLNLLTTLDVLLEEGSVARASRRLRLSPSAMSRALARLRETTGDPLLVRAGRGLVATPRAEGLRGRVHALVQEAQSLLRPVERIDPETLVRAFTLRTADGFVENFGPALIARVGAEAPGVRLNFLQKPDKGSAPLREGRVDLETAVVDQATGPELRVQALFRDRLVGVVRPDHPLAAREVGLQDYLGARHVIVSRSGFEEEAVDLAVSAAGDDPPRGGRGRRLRRGSVAGPQCRSRRDGSRAAHVGAARRHGDVWTARHHAAVHGLDVVASALRWRPGAPLAARRRTRCLRRAGFSRGLGGSRSAPGRHPQPRVDSHWARPAGLLPPIALVNGRHACLDGGCV